jgi:two-component system phosphate regulon sensor histidine kinase PhoR
MLAQVVIATALGVYGYRRYHDFHFDRELDALRRLPPVLVDRYATLLAAGRHAELDQAVKIQGAATGVRITVILESGRVAADSQASPGDMGDHRFRPEIDTAFSQGEGVATRFSSTLQHSMMYLAHRVDLPDGEVGVLRVALPLREIESNLARLTRAVALAGLLSVGATLLIIYLVSRRISRQIEGLARGASRFASGDLDYRIPHPPGRELGSLSGSLNEMAKQISGSIQALRAQQSELQAILQAMSNGVLAVDLSQRVLNVNRAAAQMLGLDPQNARGRLLQEVIRQPALHRLVEEALSSRRPQVSELTLSGAAPTRVDAVTETLLDAQGEPGGLLIVFIDRSEERRFESLRSDFAANVSHELRTPITNIQGYAETLEEVGWEDREQASRFLEIIRTNSRRLAAIVEDVMSLSKLEQPLALGTLEREVADLGPLVEGVVAQFRTAAAARSMSLATEVVGDEHVLLHPALMEQAIGNLVANAISYGPTGTTVTLRVHPSDGMLAIEVIDEGPGIPAEHLPRLFERFFRVDKARSREAGGTGLGLALVKHIAQAHGGRVEVESEVGRGSTFRILIPLGGTG